MNPHRKSPASIDTDLVQYRTCQLEQLRIVNLDRIKINQMPSDDNLEMLAVAGTRFSCAVATRSRLPIKNLRLLVDGKIPCCSRAVESVIFPEEATLIPDLLSEKQEINVAGNTTAMFILIFELPEDLECRDYYFTVKAYSTSHLEQEKSFKLKIIAPPQLKTPTPTKVTFWPHWKRFALHFNIELWSEKFWSLAECYLKEMAAGGMNVIMVSINHDPFCYPLPEEYYEYNYYPPMVKWQRDANGDFSFDFSIYDRYVELNLALGIDQEIECHALLPCKQQDPQISYYDIATKTTKTVATTPGSRLYHDAWTAFFKDFMNHNRKHGWHNMLTICPYDEPQDPQRFAEAAHFVRTLAPEIRVSAAVTSRVAMDLIDCIDIATIHLEAGYDKNAVKTLLAHGIEIRWYNCCAPDWGNTLFNCELIDSYRISWITSSGHYSGFLRWSIIDWPESWNENPGFNWPTGDVYLIAPGINGPVETLRWHAYRQGYQDLRLLQKFAYTQQCLLTEIGIDHKLQINESVGNFQQKLYHLIMDKNNRDQ